MYPRTILACLFCLTMVFSTIAVAAEAFTVTGKVFIMGEKAPMDGATVYVEGREDIEPVLTDENGWFEIELTEAGEYRINASMMGYTPNEAQAVTVSADDPKVQALIYLMPEKEFEEIVVLGERNPDKVGKRVVSGKEMRRMPGSMGDPIRAIANLPGFSGGAGFISVPAVRGSSPSDNVFYVDGMQTINLFHYGFASVFHADMVEDFNLYLSSAGPEFAEALGGVIDIKLREPNKERFTWKASVSMTESELLLEGPLAEGHSLVVTGRRSYLDLVIGPFLEEVDTGVEIVQFPWFYDYMAKYVWDMSPNAKLTLFAHGTQDGMTISMSEEAEAAKQEPVLVGEFAFDSVSNIQGITLANNFGGWAKNSLILSRRSFGQKFNAGQALEGDNNFEILNIRELLEIKAGQNHLLTLGGDEGQADLSLKFKGKTWAPNEFEKDKDITSQQTKSLSQVIKSKSHALFAKDRWKIFDPLTLVFGARWTTEDYLGDSYTMPRAAFEYSPLKDTLITFGWGEYAQFPPGQFVVEVFGNPEVYFQRSDHYTVGFKRKHSGGPWETQLEAYHKVFKDLIIPDEKFNYINGGSGQANGFEVLIKKNKSTSSDTYGWLAVTYAKSERKNDVTGEQFMFEHDQPLVVNLVAAKRMPIWTLSCRFHYSSGVPYTPVIGAEKDETGRYIPIYGEIGAERMPDQHQLDIRADRIVRYNTWKFAIFLEIQNVYMHPAVNGYQYNEDYTERKEVTGIPILAAFGIEAIF